MARIEMTLEEFLKISLRMGPTLADIEKLASRTPSEEDKKRLWEIREELFQIYGRFWEMTRGVR
jgi:hypothetical protein